MPSRPDAPLGSRQLKEGRWALMWTSRSRLAGWIWSASSDRAAATAPIPVRRGGRGSARAPRAPETATLRVLGRDRGLIEVTGQSGETIAELSARHAEILLMLAVHRQGLSADRLTELVYGPDAGEGTLRPEMVRLRKVLERVAPQRATRRFRAALCEALEARRRADGTIYALCGVSTDITERKQQEMELEKQNESKRPDAQAPLQPLPKNNGKYGAVNGLPRKKVP